ncbi:IS21-like element helper ATPase IstB [Thiorhodovibrio litoralis]|uniref:IS21-like element helper ATPase IstB n=2 Tax=Thiorhodovibrio TaxID=61593 RepID=UPI002B25BE9B|nr:IS21-like element helper ATPase IstB [Thiorhodovibrio litoralis]WPL13568.1 transposase [Thiorhodovibrio litoralis]
MLHHPTLDKLQQLRLHGMLAALREQRRLQTRLRQAKLKQQACLEDLDRHSPRGLDAALMTQLGTGQWIREGLNCLILGPTGVGKTWIACALAQQACRQGFTTRYLRTPRLFEELRLAHADGTFPKLMRSLAKTDLIVLDDWGLMSLEAEARRDLLELLDDRHGQRSTLITSQVPVEHWHGLIGDPTLADAILDRLLHSAYRQTLKGESLRKRRAPNLTPETVSE